MILNTLAVRFRQSLLLFEGLNSDGTVQLVEFDQKPIKLHTSH